MGNIREILENWKSEKLKEVNDYYNVRIKKGLPEGNIVRYKYWNLALVNDNRGNDQ